MLKNLDPRMTADLLDVLMRMGHGDELVLADRNFPAHATAASTVTGRLVELAGFMAPEAIGLICSALPLDAFVPAGALWMQADGRGDVPEPVHEDGLAVIRANLPEGGGTDRPAIVLVHGGGWNTGDSTQVAPDAQAFAAAGFPSFAIDYLLDENGKGRGWPDELHDVFDAIAWVADNADTYGVDPERIGVYGSSAGGNLVMLAATRRDGASGPAPKAVVSWSGPTDLTTLTPPTLEPGETPSTTASVDDAPPGCAGDPICIGILAPTAMVEFIGCALDECRSDYEDASPVTHVGDDSPPMYLVSFEEDLVPLDQQKAMASKLEAAGVAHELKVLSGEGHAEEARPQALAPSIAWFRQHL